MTAARPERPTWVKVGPFTFNVVWDQRKTVEYARVDGRDLFGQTHMASLQIYIDDNRPLVALQNTLLHEILHCMVWVWDVPMPFQDDEHKMEEQFVCRMDSPLLQLLKENPQVTQWLCADAERNNGA